MTAALIIIFAIVGLTCLLIWTLCRAAGDYDRNAERDFDQFSHDPFDGSRG